jgi:hypothetical protein
LSRNWLIIWISIGNWIYCTLKTRDYNRFTNSHTLEFTLARTVFSVCLHRLSGSGFQRRWSLSFRVSLLQSSLAASASQTSRPCSATAYNSGVSNASGRGDSATTSDLSVSELLTAESRLYDWRFTANHFVLATSPLRLMPEIFVLLNRFGHSPYITESETYNTTDGEPDSLSWNKTPIWVLRPDLCYCLTVAGLLMCGALSDERTAQSFTIAAGEGQRSHFRVRVPWDSWPYFTVSDSRLPLSSPPTTRRTTVEVFDSASTRDPYVTTTDFPHVASAQTV